jgi:hypothetical protein
VVDSELRVVDRWNWGKGSAWFPRIGDVECVYTLTWIMIIKGTGWCPGVAYARAYYIKADRFVSRKRARERDWNRDEIDVTSCIFLADERRRRRRRRLLSKAFVEGFAFPSSFAIPSSLLGRRVIDGCEYTSEDGSSPLPLSLFCPLAR